MYAKLTNSVDLYKGQPIYINPEHVSAVYEVSKTPGSDLTTIIYGGYQGLAWEVVERLDQAVAILKSAAAGTATLHSNVSKSNAVTDTVAIADVAAPQKKVTSKKIATAKRKTSEAVDTTGQ